MGKKAASQRKRKRPTSRSSDSEIETDHSTQLIPSIGAEMCTSFGQSIDLMEKIYKPPFGGVLPSFGFDPPPSIEPEPIDPDLGFHSMGGCEHLLEHVRTRILFPIKNREFMERHGRLPPKGIMLHGPPGTGKTLFAKCLAAELSRLDNQTYTFFMRRGADVMSKYVGESEKMVRQVFEQAIKSKPSILFFDEIDGLCPNRNNINSTCPVFTNVVCAVLGEIDKIENGDVLFMGATNRIDACDPALLRPGRCDISIPFHPPDTEGRKQIIQVYTKDWGESVPTRNLLKVLSQSTNGFTGADLNKLCSEAFFTCVRRVQKKTHGNSPSNYLKVSKISGNEKITEDDWTEALASLRPSNPNVFGSYIQNLEVSQFIQPLIQNLTDKLVMKLKLMVPKSPKLCKGPMGGPNCFLIRNECAQSDDILDLLIMPSVIGEFGGLTLFLLNEQTMLQQYNSFTMNAIIKIVNQAKDCDKPSMLFIPRIDKLAMRLGGETPLLRQLLFDTGNKSVIVVATASTDVTQLSPSLQSLFDGHERFYQLERPTKEDREAFFQIIFNKYAIEVKAGKSSNSTKMTKGNFDKLFSDTVSATNHEDMWSMITLHRELIQACKQYSMSHDKKGLACDMEKIIQEYKATKLKFPGTSRR